MGHSRWRRRQALAKHEQSKISNYMENDNRKRLAYIHPSGIKPKKVIQQERKIAQPRGRGYGLSLTRLLLKVHRGTHNSCNCSYVDGAIFNSSKEFMIIGTILFHPVRSFIAWNSRCGSVWYHKLYSQCNLKGFFYNKGETTLFGKDTSPLNGRVSRTLARQSIKSL